VKILPRNTILAGDAHERLSELLAESVDCVITSPPYFRLRDYAAPAQLGQERSVEAWVARLRAVFREIARVLKPQGSVWLNLGDGYSRHRSWGVPPKGLLAAPERLLIALMADGWLCRNKVIWAKPNPLPQSAADRLSPTYEVVYFLTRRPTYYFDLDAIRLPHRSIDRAGRLRPTERGRTYLGGNSGLGALKAAGLVGHPNGKNPGDVWSIPTAYCRDAHFATFPEALVERPLIATCPERICVQCDRPWQRAVSVLTAHTNEGARTVRKVGGLVRCDCFAPSRPGVVLDPFFGSGTVGVVARRRRRDWLGIELSPAYRTLAERRLARVTEEAA
jgi:site-specific DNA-methyltransferase (adenine-specific)